MRDASKSAAGRPAHSLTTPALLLHAAAVRANVARMAGWARGATALRPHFKSHKCLQVARMQLDTGAAGLTTATVWEAVTLAAAGLDDLLVANQVVGDEKVRALARAARECRLTVAVDDSGNAAAISAAAVAAGTRVGVLIEVDVGMRRCGVGTEADAVALAGRAAHLPGLQLRGVMGYEGHCALEVDRETRTTNVRTAMGRLVAAAAAVRSAGFPVEVVSAGGTGTFDVSGGYPGVTEVQAGAYVFMDATRERFVPGFSVGLTVLATVVSRRGETAVLDCGRKTIGAEYSLPRLLADGAAVRAVAEEHTLLDLGPDNPLRVGDTVEVVPGYVPTTVNLHEVYHVVEDGVVTEIWPILARGAGRGAVG